MATKTTEEELIGTSVIIVRFVVIVEWCLFHRFKGRVQARHNRPSTCCIV